MLVTPPSVHRVERPLDTNEWFFAVYNDLGAYLTALAAVVEGPLSEPLLRWAMEHVQERHPMLRARIEGGLLAPRWVTPPTAPVDLTVLDSKEALSLERITEAELHRPYDPARAPMWRCTFVRGRGDGPHQLVLGVHHSVADGLSGLNIFTDLLSACAALHDGRRLPPRLPVGATLDSTLGSPTVFERVRIKLRHARSRLAGPPPAPPPLEALAPPEERRTRVLFRSLPAELVAALGARAREERSTFTGAFSAALLEAVQARIGPLDRVTLNYAISLRGERIPAEQVGSFAGSVSTTHPLRGDRSFWSVARRASRSLRAGVEGGAALDVVRVNRGHVSEAIEELRRIQLDPRCAGREGFLALSSRGTWPDPSAGSFRVRALYPATANHGLGNHFQMSCGIVGRTLYSSIMFVEPLHSEATGRAIVDGFQACLEREAAPPAAGPRVKATT